MDDDFNEIEVVNGDNNEGDITHQKKARKAKTSGPQKKKTEKSSSGDGGPNNNHTSSSGIRGSIIGDAQKPAKSGANGIDPLTSSFSELSEKIENLHKDSKKVVQAQSKMKDVHGSSDAEYDTNGASQF